MNDPRFLVFTDLLERTFALEQDIRIRYLDYKQIQKANLYNCYCRVLVDLGLWDCYNEYKSRKEGETERKEE